MSQTNVLDRLHELRRRHLMLSTLASVGLGVVALVGLLALCIWVDLVLELAPGLRIASLVAIAGAAIAVMILPVRAMRRRLTRQYLARDLDRAGNGGGEILSGSDLAEAGGGEGELTQALAALTVRRAGDLAGGIAIEKAAPLSTIRRALGGAIAAVVIAGIICMVAPRLVRMQWARLVDPFGDHPPYSRTELTITPGNTAVVYGHPLDVSVTASGDVESAELVWLSASGQQVLPMFRETGGRWRGTIAEATEAGQYYIRTPAARSYRYRVDVVMVPQIQTVRFRITPPAYTRKPTYEGPAPQDGISGLAGTKVELTVTSNRPLAGGTLELVRPDAVPAATTRPATKVTLSPTASAAPKVQGAFTLAESGKLMIKVRDVEGHWSSEAFTAQVNLTKDGRPLVRLLQPQPTSLATPSTLLPLHASGEDDYGVARLQAFRSLNGSRPRAAEFAVPIPTLTRADGSIVLNLAALKLQPGDSLEFFARVEDNDPAGAKGAETPITSVRIITEQEMHDLQVAQAGLENLLSKYQEAQRRLETLQEQLATLEKTIKENGEGSAAAKAELKKAIESLRQTQGQLEELRADAMPLAMDKALDAELGQLIDQVRKAGEQLQGATAPGSAAAAVAKARETLAKAEKSYQDDALAPLDRFAKIYALKEDEARFVDLYLHQKDLADRLAAMKGRGSAEDSASKARMRDLEEEQTGVREELDALLQQIENHVAELPEGSEFDKLRASATRFVDKARASGAGNKMMDAEVALAAFSGDDAWSHADEAARRLKALMSECNAMGENAGVCMSFAPKLSGAMTQTTRQLLEGSGLSGQLGSGRNGYSARRNSLRNVGLYGSRPRESRASSGNDRTNAGVLFRTHAANSDGRTAAATANSNGQTQAASQTPIPDQYRRRVSDYYQRVADELGDDRPADRKTGR